MKDTTLYEQLLGLKAPWSVKSIDLPLTDQRVVVEVVLKQGQVWADPTDSSKRAHINSWHEREWRQSLIVGTKVFPSNPYDGHTLAEQIE